MLKKSAFLFAILGTLAVLAPRAAATPPAMDAQHFQPHADHRDMESYPLLHGVHIAMSGLIYGVFAFWGAHLLLWLNRSLRERGTES